MIIRVGCSRYILKSSGLSQILNAVREVSRSQQYIEPGLERTIFDKKSQTVNEVIGVPKLTNREQEILQLLASENTSIEISKKLFISKRTIDNHRLNL